VKFRYRRFDIILGILIYSSGDTAASLMLSEFSIWRLLGMMFIGGTVYAFEIPNYFRWIDYRTGGLKGMQASLLRTGLAFLYFNPLWIARHLLFIQVFSGNWGGINFNLLKLGLYSEQNFSEMEVSRQCSVLVSDGFLLCTQQGTFRINSTRIKMEFVLITIVIQERKEKPCTEE
jgi:hypothetical protein